ncbi:MAG: UbiD family decarboxylase [Methanomicrobiales archaeon]|nr:UbiD family decarboxylase [Methanomicrobiales archaeon]
MREFLEKMRDASLVTDVEEHCSSVFEAPRIASRTDRILVFHDVDGKRAVMNLTGNRDILAQALSVKSTDLVHHLARASYDGNVTVEGKVRTRAADLTCFPVMQYYPKDAGRYITAGIVCSCFDDVQNASVHRMLILDERHVAARLVEGRHTQTMHQKALQRGESLPVAVVIGVHPAVIFAASTRVPAGRELNFAAELLGGEIPVRECSNGVLVPDAEIILEGSIGAETAAEGPFVDITGTYDPVREQPIIAFTGMSAKKDPLYHAILPGGREHKVLMGVPYEPKIFRTVGEVTDVRNVVLTQGGCGYLHAVVQIHKNTQGDAKNAIMAAFAAHTSLKHIVIVDEDIDPFSMEDVEYAIATRVRGDRDLLVITGVRGSSLDPSRAEDGTNVKIGIDATMDLQDRESFARAEWT